MMKNFKKNFDKYKKRGLAVNITFTIIGILMFIYALSLLYPFFWAFINSLKGHEEYYTNKFSLPSKPLFENYVKAFTELKIQRTASLDYIKFYQMFLNSLWFTFIGAGLNIFCSLMVAYALSKYSFKGAGLIYAVAIFSMIIPVVGSLPAMYKLVYTLKINNPLFLVTACSGFGFNFIVFYGAFKSVSWNYAEAAFIDGASNWSVFLKIMIPQTMPVIVSLFIITAIGRWNDYLSPLLFLGDYPTIASGLYVFQIQSPVGGNKPIYYAALLISLLPILVIFIAFQDSIMKNMVAGGLKG